VTTCVGSLVGVVVPEISVDELAERLSAGAFLVDVRQPDEYLSGHVYGAVLVPLSEVPDHVDELPADGPVLIICRSGARSHAAAEYLIGRGREAVNVAGGTLAWMESGRDVVVSAEPT
jgi:rhodanese-related sulfurtransferase